MTPPACAGPPPTPSKDELQAARLAEAYGALREAARSEPAAS